MFNKICQYKAMNLIKASDQGLTRTEIINQCANNISRKDLDEVLRKIHKIGVLEVIIRDKHIDTSDLQFDPTIRVRGMRYRIKRSQDISS